MQSANALAVAMGLERRTLGATGISVPALGVGAGFWGETLVGYGKQYGEDDLYATFRASLDAGVDFFDTAPVYGRGESERLIGRFRRRDGRPILIATKYENSMIFAPSVRRSTPKAMHAELDASLQRLGVERIDLYQIHYPVAANAIDDYAEVLARVVKTGKVRAVGVSNFNASLLRAMHSSLAARGIPLASNQVAFNVVNRTMMDNGVLDACRELGISLIAYHPLAQGILTGKFRNGQRQPARSVALSFRFLDAMFGRWELDAGHENGANRGMIRRIFTKPPVLGDLEPLFQAMDDVARRHECSNVQVALNWLLATDPCVIPIPGAKNPRQLGENLASLDWRMTREERDSIDVAFRALNTV
jgi:aryl-alcohol dehydrogenase-like predicted oxidoreductase